MNLAATILKHAASREVLEDTVELILEVLDWMDGDPDLEESEPDEDGGDYESSLGWTLSASLETLLANADLEDEHDGLEPDLGF